MTEQIDISLAVNVTSHSPGVTPVAFLAVVECIDPDGEKVYQIVGTDGITEKRRAALLGALDGPL